jgi:thiamine pyrophosphate-dependent acetolactate synthase large subunit-like protein
VAGKGSKSAAARPKTRARVSGTDRPPATGAEALVAQLEALGVEVVFGIPGVHNLAIFDALDRSKIRTILVRHEQTCVFAADGYARATGRLGVAVTTTGPGAANTAAAMGEARASRSPVLHISTQSESRIFEGRGGRFSLHESPHQREMMDALARWSGTVANPDAIPTMALRGAHEAFAGRRGPAFLEIPHDHLAAPVHWGAQKPPRERGLPPEPAQIERAVKVLSSAEQPVIWAGGGAVSSGAGEVLTKVAEALDAPVVATFAGKGLLPGEHPLAVGFPPHQPQVTELLESSDAILIVGSDLDGMNTQGWRIPLPRPRVGINTVAQDCRRNYACNVVVEADAREALEAVLPSLTTRKGGAGARRVARVRKAADAMLRKSKEFSEPYGFTRAVSAALPPDAFVVADMAIPGYWMAAYYTPSEPRTFAYPLGWGTLGFALPASIGAAAAGRRTLVVTGDAGLMYAPGELATAVQEKLPITVLVVNDEGYGMLRFDEQERFGRAFSTDLVVPDFVALARSFNVVAKRTTMKELEAALRLAFKRSDPSLIELPARFAPPLTTSPRWPLKGRKEARP